MSLLLVVSSQVCTKQRNCMSALLRELGAGVSDSDPRQRFELICIYACKYVALWMCTTRERKTRYVDVWEPADEMGR